jgi:hypothetical protein
MTAKSDGKVNLSLSHLITLAVLGLGLSGWLWTMHADLDHMKKDMAEVRSDVKLIRERMDKCVVPSKLVGHP